MLHTFLGCAFVALGGFLAGAIMVGLRAGTVPTWLGYLSGIAPMLAWNYMVRMSSLSMSHVTLVFEVVLVVSSLVALAVWGYRPTAFQMVGVVVSVFGLAMMASAK